MTTEIAQTSTEQSLKYSGLGIASFVTSIVGAFFLFAMFAAAGVLEVTTPGGLDEKSPAAVIIGLSLIAGIGLEVIAIGLGIAGYFQKDRKALFAILGAIFATIGLLGSLALMLIGMMAESAS